MKVSACRFPGAAPLFLCCLLFFSGRLVHSESAEQLPRPTAYVNDFANVLSAQSVAELDRACAELDRSTANAQLVIVTVHTLDGLDAADYANRLEDRWRIGRKGSDRGILLLLAVDDRKWRIDVGYGLEGILNDARIGEIGRSMVPFLRAGAYDSAAKEAVSQLSQVIAADAQITLSQTPPQQRVPAPTGVAAFLPVVVFPMFAILAVSFLILLYYFAFGPGKVVSGRGDGPDSSGSSGSSGGDSGGAESGPSDGGSFGGGGAGGNW